jgi:hypothetical protein
MRATALIFAALLGVTASAASPEAAPAVPRNAASPTILLVAGGCGPGFHHRHWRDRFGHWHLGRCVPNR